MMKTWLHGIYVCQGARAQGYCMRLRQGKGWRTANYLRTRARIQRYAGMRRHMWEHSE